ncbi:uncharacterized protein LOC112169297 isoform X2 [Rosa chinensis]|nr:uncharacterized protein LOC112169297 isoform X2 [Rosa chinensis]
MYEDFDHDDLDNLPPQLPLPLKELCHWANIFSKNRVTIHTIYIVNPVGPLGQYIVNPAEEVVHFMDPFKRRLITGEWKTIVDNSIKIYNAQKTKKGRKIVTWKNCAGIPEQQGDKTCGFWIMHYMKYIVEDKNQEWSAKYMGQKGKQHVHTK